MALKIKDYDFFDNLEKFDKDYSIIIKASCCNLFQLNNLNEVTNKYIDDFYALDLQSRLELIALSIKIDESFEINPKNDYLRAVQLSRKQFNLLKSLDLADLMKVASTFYESLISADKKIINNKFHIKCIGNQIMNIGDLVIFGIQAILSTYLISKGIAIDSKFPIIVGSTLATIGFLNYFHPAKALFFSVANGINKNTQLKSINYLNAIGYIIRNKYGIDDDLILYLVQREMVRNEIEIEKLFGFNKENQGVENN